MTTQKSMLYAVLYELQPFRVSDLIYWLKYVCNNGYDILRIPLSALSWINENKSFVMSILTLKNSVILSIWILGFYTSNKYDFASLWIIATLFAMIFLNLRDKADGELSAYSVFNKGFRSLLGTLTAEQFDQEIRHRHHDDNPDVRQQQGQENIGGEEIIKDNRHLRRGKKARRNYEDKLKKRQQQQLFMEEAFQMGQQE